ncbi:MAG: Yip1 family protein [Chloroflexota bacterium]
MVNRIIGVFRLDVNTFEEIEHDESATVQAAIIVAIVAVLAGAGGFIAANSVGQLAGFIEGLEGAGEFVVPQMNPVGAAISAIINTFIGWFVWSGLTFFVGTNMFGGKATMGEMLRVIGFSMAPRFLQIIPCVGWIGWIWALVAGFIGIRQGLDLDNGKTALTILISIAGYWVVSFIISLILTPIFGL